MMRRIVVFILVFLFSVGNINAQGLIPIKYVSEEDNRLLKENDTLRYYAASGDSVNVVAINEELLYYKLVNKRKKSKVVAEGGIIPNGDGYLQHGHWIQYDANGSVEITGSYLRGKPVGSWATYYQDGRVKTEVHYAMITDKDGTNSCMSGEYRDYYANGKLKTLGFYTADRNRYQDTLLVEDPLTGGKLVKTLYKSVYTPRKTGLWEYYTDEGELEKKEDL